MNKIKIRMDLKRNYKKNQSNSNYSQLLYIPTSSVIRELIAQYCLKKKNVEYHNNVVI